MKLILILFFVLFSKVCFADQEFDYCLEMAKKINTLVPLQIDKETTWRGSECKKGNPNVMQYYYYLSMEIPPENVPKIDEIFKAFKDDGITYSLKSWCTNPEMLSLLSLYDVEYVYRDIKGRYIGTYGIKEKDCKK